MFDESLTFVHFSDTHIVRPGVRLREVETCATLTQVVETVNHLDPQPAFVVIGGDLVSPDVEPEVEARGFTVRDYEAAYEAFREIVSRLSVPVHFVMGNHDRRVPFRRVVLQEVQPWDRPHYYAFDAGRYRICLLDTLQPGRDPGALSRPQVAWLRKQLLQHADQLAILVVHHHAIPVGVPRLDEQILQNVQDLWQVAREGGNVCAVLCGHVHMSSEAVQDGIPIFTTPSTCFQISRDPEQPGPVPGPPQLRLVTCRGREVSTTVLSV
jgi:3',5'-cyclic AMP phosphodiesterase CpdA